MWLIGNGLKSGDQRMTLGAVKRVVAMLGLKNAFIYGFSRLLGVVSCDRFYIIRYHLIAQPVLADKPIEPRHAGGFEVRPVLRDDPIVASLPRPAHVIHKRFADGAVCFVAHSDERLVGFLWLKRERYEEDEVRCTFIPDPGHLAAWDFDLHIEPAYRMSRAFARLWQAAHEYLSREGFKWTFSRISAFKPDALRSHQRLGAIDAGAVTFIILGSIQISVLSGAPFLHMSVSDQSRPRLLLRVPER